jgi:hypothetical protein
MSTDYTDYPEHPLHKVPQEILDAAREALHDVAIWKDVDRDMATPIADSVVVALIPWLRTRRTDRPRKPKPLPTNE